MTNYTIYDETNAPEGSRETLTAIKGGMGFIPNIMGTMAEAPSTLKAYVQLIELMGATSLTPQEQRLLTLAVSKENECGYCLAAEGMLAHKVAKVPLDEVQATQERRSLSDEKLNIFVNFVREVASNRGHPSEGATSAFLEAGYTQANTLEVVLGVAMKTLTNYTNHIAKTPIDDAFADYIPGPAKAA